MHHINIVSRRGFLNRSLKIGAGIALSTLVDIPFVMRRALAEGIGQGTNKKKLLFIFLRGANDGLNSVVPVQDASYYTARPVAAGNTPNIGIPTDPGTDYAAAGGCDFFASGAGPTFGFSNAIRLGNKFAALHPSLKFLAPVYNAGDLALVHRVGYPRQSRSHFDSQNYWENGNPNNNLSKDGIFYRTIIESQLANTAPLTGVSIQSSLPLILRGSDAAMTNLSDVNRYNLLGVPNTGGGNLKADRGLSQGNQAAFASKRNRELLSLQYQNLMNTLPLFTDIAAQLGTDFVDNENTDGDFPYVLFPRNNDTNGGYVRTASPRVVDPQKYVVPANDYGFFTNLKAAALVLNKTDTFIAGTQLDGFDTHNMQGGVTGAHANLQRRIGWAMYALRKYFMQHADKAAWQDLVVVTLSEFGRTTVQNSDLGTDHAEAGVMFVSGGAVKGYNKGNASGVFGCGTSDSIRNATDSLPWVAGPANQTGGVDGSMFAVSDRYLRRTVDYRSVLGELIRDHLGADQAQLNRIIPAYTIAGERLQAGGTSTVDNTPIVGELGLV